MNRMLWAFLSYPISLSVVFVAVVFPLGGIEDMLYMCGLFLIWLVLAVWFGIGYLRHALLKDLRGFLGLAAANILSLGLMFIIMHEPGLDRKIGSVSKIASVAFVLSVSCFIVFSIIGFACKKMGRENRGVHDISETKP